VVYLRIFAHRCCRGESGNGESSNRKRKCWWPLHITSTSAKEKEDEEVIIFVCTLCHSNHSSRCVDRTYPFLTNDPREPLKIMEECDNTYDCILFQYCFFNIEELKQHTHTERYHLHPLLNESNANLLERLHDDEDDKRFVLSITTTTKQLAHVPSVCRPN
jgi:hypothetical protein